jgi:FlaA1/EpsC-like NDP-sugar epimerase
MLLREIARRHAARYEPVGFLDDDRRKHGRNIHGIAVLGAVEELPALAKYRGVRDVIIAAPSATGAQMRTIVEHCKAAGVSFKTIPGIDHLIDGRVTVSQLREVAIEDLLGRDPITLDMAAISHVMSGRTVLVSGAGGSIGSEICRQVCRFDPAALVLVERSENNLFNIHRELERTFPHVRIVPRLADVADLPRMDEVFASHRPAVVFHAAAHKHVPMLEWNPGEGVQNNVFGTKAMADLSDQYRVDRFVMVSTDKAVNPTSVMGTTKRIAEIYVQALARRSRTKFVTVRFGNVLGSAGSVIPIFREQIARGGPVTITDPEMRRYFMTIPEASQLMLQAGAMGDGGEIFILDMGEPVKIIDLARDLITLSGLEPGVDIEIQFTGLRPGEKLFEEISVDAENAEKTRHPKIFVGRSRTITWEVVISQLAMLDALEKSTPEAIRRLLMDLVPEYTPVIPDAARVPSIEPALSVRRVAATA